jgi:hypothetical protein
MFTSACLHLFLSWARSIQSVPCQPTSRRSILISPSHLCLGLSSGFFHWDFPTRTLYSPLLTPIYATCPAHLILQGLIPWIIICEEHRSLTLILLMWRIGWAPNSIPIYVYIQQDTLHSLFISGNCSTRFGWYFHPSSGALTTVSAASGVCHTVTAIYRYCGKVGTGFSMLWVAYVTHSTLKPVPTLPR